MASSTTRATVFLLAAIACRSEDEPAGFGHNSPRPECQYTPDPTRVPQLMPQSLVSGWGAPVKLSTLNTACPEDAIEISRDGATLYYYWSPTVDASFNELLNGTTGTYYAERVGTGPDSFANPRFFDLRQGTPTGACDAELSFTPTGDEVYFHSTRLANTGYQHEPPIDDPMDVYVATVTAGVPGLARNLGPIVNSVYMDGEQALSPDGSKLYLTSNRPGGVGGSDIWVSTKTSGAWSPPVNLGAPINSTSNDLQPAFAGNDPSTLYFTSDRGGAVGIYRSVFDGAGWSEPELTISGYVGEPSLVADGTILYFVHVLVDETGVFGADIWYVERANG